ncbi:MAG: hypothetical protein U1C33_05585, partial [Candidatus Cloacimonadaceae bacterium]|nr:hypothetical protein [Candidatus Cloacimonadaceae bacterium]
MNILPSFISTKIRNKVFSSFLVVLVLLSVIFAVSNAVIQRLGKASENILQMNYNSIIYTIQMLQEADAIERNAMLYYNRGDSLAYRKKLAEKNSFAGWLAKSKDNVTETDEPQILAEIDTLFTLFLYEVDHLTSSNASRSEISLENLDLYRIRLKQACIKLLETNQQVMFKKSRK